MNPRRSLVLKRFKISFIASILLFTLPLLAEEAEAEKNWSNTTELGLVNTTGNTETTNFAITNKYATAVGKGTFKLDFDALRSETTARTFEDVGGVPTVVDTTTVSAESYRLNGQYDRPITERLNWYVRAGWYSDEFAGIDNSYSAGAGIGYLFFTNDTHTLKSELGLGFVKEEFIGGADTDFAELRAFLAYDRKLSESSKLFSELEILENLDETSDVRANGLIGVSANLSKRIALAVSYAMKYDAEPGITFPWVDFPTAEYEFDDLDTTLKASLVINF
jgi:putative salt-induced outer membrane protein YdiY